MKSTTTGGTRTRNPRLTRHFIHVEVHRLGGRCLIHWATVAHNRFKGMSARPIDAQVTYPNRMAHNRARKTVFADRPSTLSPVLFSHRTPIHLPPQFCFAQLSIMSKKKQTQESLLKELRTTLVPRHGGPFILSNGIQGMILTIYPNNERSLHALWEKYSTTTEQKQTCMSQAMSSRA